MTKLFPTHLKFTEHANLRIGPSCKPFKGAKVGGSHRKNQIPTLKLPHLDLAGSVRGNAISALSQRSRSTRVDPVSMLFIANPGRINNNIKPTLCDDFTQDFFGHDRAADIAGTHHKDAIGHGISSLAEK